MEVNLTDDKFEDAMRQIQKDEKRSKADTKQDMEESGKKDQPSQ